MYASFKDPEIRAFVDQALSWSDPCAELGGRASCEGSVARRCSAVNESLRRVVDFDCQSLGLACDLRADGSAGCGAAG